MKGGGSLKGWEDMGRLAFIPKFGRFDGVKNSPSVGDCSNCSTKAIPHLFAVFHEFWGLGEMLPNTQHPEGIAIQYDEQLCFVGSVVDHHLLFSKHMNFCLYHHLRQKLFVQNGLVQLLSLPSHGCPFLLPVIDSEDTALLAPQDPGPVMPCRWSQISTMMMDKFGCISWDQNK